MKLYGSKFMKSGVQKQIHQNVESRDGILIDVFTADRVARVKIQGSSQLIVAHYPENWEAAPIWLKPGNAVRISHPGGIRGRIELVGHGAFIPTAVVGDSNTVTNPSPDAIISGLTLVPGSGMSVQVLHGSARFSGTTTATTTLLMGGNGYLGGEGYLDGITANIAINAAPSAGTYRYDLIVIGSNMTFDYVAGTAAASPVMPAVPSGHLLCGWILVSPGVTQISRLEINKTFTAVTASYMTVAVADNDLAWAELSTTVTVSIKDQFTQPISGNWTVTLAFSEGNGLLSFGGGTPASTATGQTTGSTIAFTYTRNQDSGDLSPLLVANLVGTYVVGYCAFTLRDIDGLPM